MRYKGIVCLALGLAFSVSAHAVDERILMAPGRAVERLAGADSSLPGGEKETRALATGSSAWLSDNAVAVRGYRGGTDYILAPAEYRLDSATDLLLHFDEARPEDEAANYDCRAGSSFSIDRHRALLGGGAALFKGPNSALSLSPRPGALFLNGSRFRDFAIEFWLYPAVAENGEVIIEWKSLRKLPKGIEPETLSCVILGGRISWSFNNFFERPVLGGGSRAEIATRVELRAKSPLVPKTWSHHLLRFDGDTGLLEYLVDGVPEATTYATVDGHEGTSGGSGGGVFAPAIGASAPLLVGADYSGLMDEFRLSKASVDKPSLNAYGTDPGLVISPVADLGAGHSRLRSIEVTRKTPTDTSIEFSYRISDEWVGWGLDSPEWIPFRPGQSLPDSALGRYVQVRAELYSDGRGKASPALSSYVLHFEPDELPPPPARVVATPKDGAIELRWSRVPESDLAGYLVYYGDAPGEYYGTEAVEGASPLDAGLTTTVTLTGIPNGKLIYIVIAAYDSAAPPGAAATRAGEFSKEVAARPSRTAQ
jgi:hypothetical protein